MPCSSPNLACPLIADCQTELRNQRTPWTSACLLPLCSSHPPPPPRISSTRISERFLRCYSHDLSFLLLVLCFPQSNIPHDALVSAQSLLCLTFFREAWAFLGSFLPLQFAASRSYTPGALWLRILTVIENSRARTESRWNHSASSLYCYQLSTSSVKKMPEFPTTV